MEAEAGDFVLGQCEKPGSQHQDFSGQDVTGSRILPVTVNGNTVGSLDLDWTEEEPSLGWLWSFLAHFLHTWATS